MRRFLNWMLRRPRRTEWLTIRGISYLVRWGRDGKLSAIHEGRVVAIGAEDIEQLAGWLYDPASFPARHVRESTTRIAP